jgi:hypothetical protein
MLFSSGDSLRTLSSILSGEGFDEREQRESPLTTFHLQRLSAGPEHTITVPFIVLSYKWHGHPPYVNK